MGNGESLSSGDPNLRSKATRGAGFILVAQFASQVLGVVNLAIVARFLGPEDFGVYALGIVVMTAAETFTALGTERILIQRPAMDGDFVGAAWLVRIIRGVFISGVCFAIAPVYASVVNEPQAEHVVWILALGPVLYGLNSPGEVLAQRQLQFGRIAVFQISTRVVQSLLIVSLAYYLRNVYALAFGSLATSLLRCGFSWMWFGVPHLPRYHRTHFRELLSRGRHYFVISSCTFVTAHADDLLIGRYLGSATLGYYHLAYRFSEWVVDLLSSVVGIVALPMFSKLQGESERLRRALDQVFQIQMAVLAPICVFILFFSDLIVNGLLGEEYQASALLVQVLVAVTVGRAVSHALVPIMIGTGKERSTSRIKVVETIFFIPAVWIGCVVYGVVGAALGAGIGYLFAGACRVIFVIKLTKFPVGLFLKRLAAPTVAAAAGGAVALFSGRMDVLPVVELVLCGCVFGLAYILFSSVLQRELFEVLKANVQSVILSRRSNTQ
jgi:O-antigen/teichoic acid export membrane protein